MDLKRSPDADSGAHLSKKPRHSSHLKRVADIVLTLSALSKIRGGRSPTAAEIDLIHEARAKLTDLCHDLPPNEIVANEAISAVIENLGLNRKNKDPGLGFRGPQLTVAEKFALTKRKMEESKKYGCTPAAYPPQQQLKPSFSVADSPNHAAVSSGGYAASPNVHVSAVTPNVATSAMQYQLPVGSPNMVRGSNGSSYAYQAQAANSPVNHPPVDAPNWSTQAQVPNQTPVKVEGAAAGTIKSPMTPPSAAHDQNSRSFASPAMSGGQQQPSSKIRFVQTPSGSNNHNEIARIIQKLLQPQLPDQPTWIPPSRDYMSKALTCQTCQLSINEIDNVLICDACEKGYHITCAQAPNQGGIPRGEWHCARCLSLSNGKPLPPKYGRVMRSNIQLKTPTNMVPSTTVASSTVSPGMGVVQMSPGNKAGAVNQKGSEQKINASVNTAPQNPAGAEKTDRSETDSKPAKEMQGNDLPSGSVNTNEKSSSELIGDPELSALDGTPSQIKAEPSDLSNKDADQKTSTASETEGTELPSSSNNMDEKPDERPVEVSAEAPADKKDSDPNISSETETQGNSDPSSSQDRDEKPLSGTEMDNPESSRLIMPSAEPPTNLSNKDADSNILDATEMQGLPNYGEDLSFAIRDDQDIAKENTCENLVVSNETLEYVEFNFDGVRPVEWIGDPIQVVSEKKYYSSCFLDGVKYELQTYALFQSSDGKLVPSKLQSMWEDMKTGSKWVAVNNCYFPSDLPEKIDRPYTPESTEVYESNHESTVMADLIQGPCEVLPLAAFNEEIERRSQLGADTNNELPPVFLCNWIYDESKGLLQPVSQ